MTKPRYQKIVNLTATENMIVEALKAEKIGTIDIFRKGLKYYAPQVPKALLNKVKGLVKGQ